MCKTVPMPKPPKPFFQDVFAPKCPRDLFNVGVVPLYRCRGLVFLCPVRDAATARSAADSCAAAATADDAPPATLATHDEVVGEAAARRRRRHHHRRRRNSGFWARDVRVSPKQLEEKKLVAVKQTTISRAKT